MMKLIIALMLFSLVACGVVPDGIFESDYDADQIEKARAGLVIINTIGALKLEDGKVIARNSRAIAIPIGNGYILALTHCVKVRDRVMVRTPFGIMPLFGEVVKQDTYLNGELLELVGMKEDICLLRSKKFKEAYPFPFGNSDNIRIGDKVLSAGFSFAKDFNVKDGIISTLNVPKAFLKNDNLGKSTDMFMHSTPINGGDSGSPLFAIRDGNLEIIGLINAMLKDHGMSFALKSNYVLKTIEQIKKAKI